uniref:Charged multivesicular body protein 6 n=1 Tax=Anas zonorhyncha TaxID=75864 RepID=A0A8B9U3F8_9AVES
MGPRRGAWLHPMGVATTSGRGHAAAPIHPAARRPAHLPVTPTPSPRAPSVTWRRAAPARCGGAAALHKMSALGAVEAGTGTGTGAMGNLFGRKRRSRVTEQDKAVLQLKQQRDKLRQYQKRISLNMERERALARQLLKEGKKEKALLLLKKKRYQEQLLDRTDNQISNLERMVQDIEFTQIEMKVIEGLKIGNECLNKMHQVMSIEEVERIIGETQDAVEYQRQIDELLAGSLTEEDEDAILEELNTITQEQLELPEVPSEPLPTETAEPTPIKNRPKPELVAAS